MLVRTLGAQHAIAPDKFQEASLNELIELGLLSKFILYPVTVTFNHEVNVILSDYSLRIPTQSDRQSGSVQKTRSCMKIIMISSKIPP